MRLSHAWWSPLGPDSGSTVAVLRCSTGRVASSSAGRMQPCSVSARQGAGRHLASGLGGSVAMKGPRCSTLPDQYNTVTTRRQRAVLLCYTCEDDQFRSGLIILCRWCGISPLKSYLGQTSSPPMTLVPRMHFRMEDRTFSGHLARLHRADRAVDNQRRRLLQCRACQAGAPAVAFRAGVPARILSAS